MNKHWLNFVYIALVISAVMGVALLARFSDSVCRDSVEVRVTSDTVFKCHKDATLSYVPHITREDSVLVVCTCKH